VKEISLVARGVVIIDLQSDESRILSQPNSWEAPMSKFMFDDAAIIKFIT